MTDQYIVNRDFSNELTFSACRSSGPGGQNVNKVSTKIELRFNVGKSILLTEEEKEVIRDFLKNRINNEDELIILCQTERSQLKNKEKSIEKFYSLIEKALKPKKKRKPTKPSHGEKEKRLEEKRLKSEKKEARKIIFID